jgi:uncharacterized protein YjbI with pentapeptide repeats/DNA-binding Xre family transcriptional regulator
MTKPQENYRRERFTYRATAEGIQIAEKTLRRFGFESKEAFAKSIRMSRVTFKNFLNGEGIQLDSLQRICKALELDWLEITGLKSDTSAVRVSEILLPAIGAEVREKSRSSERRVTVKDGENGNTKAILIISGDVNSDANFMSLQAFIKHHVGDSIQIEDIREGSIKLFLSGSLKDIQRLRTLIDSGELSELDDLPIQSIKITENWEKEREKSNNKWKLIEDIITNSIGNLQLQRIDLSDTDLNGANLVAAELNGANLVAAELNGADMSRAELNGADMSRAELNGADMSRAELNGADMSRAELNGANLIEANLNGANLNRAKLSGANLNGANLNEANLIETNLNGANLNGANLNGANLNGANLNGADLRETNFSRANLSEAKLNRVNLGEANLNRANLNGANLNGADLRETNLHRANLNGANLRETNLHRANLNGANLNGANLYETNLSGADLSGADLSGANLNGANLNGANLISSNVRNAIFIDTFGLLNRDRINLKLRGAIFGNLPPILEEIQNSDKSAS